MMSATECCVECPPAIWSASPHLHHEPESSKSPRAVEDISPCSYAKDTMSQWLTLVALTSHIMKTRGQATLRPSPVRVPTPTESWVCHLYLLTCGYIHLEKSESTVRVMCFWLLHLHSSLHHSLGVHLAYTHLLEYGEGWLIWSYHFLPHPYIALITSVY